MKNKRKGFAGWSVLFFMLTLGVALFSWVGSIYGVGHVQSLLSAEGVRWWMGNVMSNYLQTPALGVVLVLMMGLGVVVQSGLWNAMKRFFQPGTLLSRKERRALMFGLGVLSVYALLIVVSILLPWNIAQGVIGGWLHSPLFKGLVYVFSLGIGLSGLVYGYASDTFLRFSDVFEAMSLLVARYASFFVMLFFLAQFFASMTYTRMDECLGISPEFLSLVSQLCSYIPLFLWKCNCKCVNA